MRFMSCLLNFSIYEYETTSYNIINDIDDKLSVCYNPRHSCRGFVVYISGTRPLPTASGSSEDDYL